MKGKVPITTVRHYNLPVMHKPSMGTKAYKNPNERGTNRFRSIYEPKPMPEEMKPLQNPDWLYTRKRKYARPLIFEPLERAKRSIHLAGKLATTSVSRYDRYQLPENNLPKNPQYQATIMPHRGYVSSIQANIARSKKYTHAPASQRYLYNNTTDIEKKYYNGEMENYVNNNESAQSTQQFYTPTPGALPADIQAQLPSTSRNFSNHIPMEAQLKLALKGR